MPHAIAGPLVSGPAVEPDTGSEVRPEHLEPTAFIDSQHPAVAEFAARAVGDADDPHERISRLFLAVRDGIRYDPYTATDDPDDYVASNVIGRTGAYCIPQVGGARRRRPLDRDPRAAGVRRRPQSPPVRPPPGADGRLGRVRLPRLRRAARRRRVAQGHLGVQRLAVLALRRAAAGVRRHRGRDVAPVHRRWRPVHGVRPRARELHRSAARRDRRGVQSASTPR